MSQHDELGQRSLILSNNSHGTNVRVILFGKSPHDDNEELLFNK